MKYIVKVQVQLPDGKFLYCPAATNTDKGPEVAKFNSEREASDWAEICLWAKTIVYEDK